MIEALIAEGAPTGVPRPAANGCGPGSTASRLVETHTAHVLMVGDRVYKWKKALDLGFADFRSLAARKRACEDEVRLNRRLAPDVYLGVDVLMGENVVTEYVVVMRRLPEDTRLSTLLVAGGDDVGHHLRLVARKVADFHTRCAPSSDPASVAGPRRIRQLWDIGLDALSAAAPDVLDRLDVAEARSLVVAFLEGRRQLLDRRIAGGFVRDGHGDLLADDIFCLPDGPRILDCLDFDEGLRHGDVLGDVATLAMDLERLGGERAARQLVRDYIEFSGERHPESLEHLYIAYRAQVRAKVALIRADQTPDPAVRQEQHQQASDLVRLMLSHLRRSRVTLILVGGLPGAGKTTVAAGLSERAGWLVHSSDLVRKELQIPLAERYTKASVDRVYLVLLERARAGLEQGWNVVLDASWGEAQQRNLASQLAANTSSTLVELRCVAAAEIAEDRLTSRPDNHPSDADPTVRRALERSASSWATAIAVDTNGRPEAAVAAALTAVQLP